MLAALSWQSRSLAEVVADQLEGIDRWVALHRREREALTAESAGREDKMVAGQRLAALDFEREALLSRAERLMRDDGEPWLGSELPRSVIAHRHPWFRDKLAARLRARPSAVLECLEDGAEAIAATVLHQPDLLVIGDLLPRVPAHELVQRVQALAPRTLVVVQVTEPARAPVMTAAGAGLVVSHRVPTVEVADEALRCLVEADVPRTLG